MKNEIKTAVETGETDRQELHSAFALPLSPFSAVRNKKAPSLAAKGAFIF